MPTLTLPVRSGAALEWVNPARTPAPSWPRGYVETCPWIGRAADNGVGAAGEDEDTT